MVIANPEGVPEQESISVEEQEAFKRELAAAISSHEEKEEELTEQEVEAELDKIFNHPETALEDIRDLQRVWDNRDSIDEKRRNQARDKLTRLEQLIQAFMDADGDNKEALRGSIAVEVWRFRSFVKAVQDEAAK